MPKIPKIKPKKGDAQNDRNKININENRPTFNSNKTTPTISYANAAKNEQQMAARKPVSEPATNSSESNSETNIQNPAPLLGYLPSNPRIPKLLRKTSRTNNHWESPEKRLF
ncbi:hypothetical protein TNCV_4585601 [Trichonephila clavipes]|nr:hypothetical protein TNCV_4585601 [Trichonephila clavipes]